VKLRTKLLILCAAVAAVAAMVAVPAFALQGGTPDGNAHPYVGMSVFPTSDPNFVNICTGTLVAPQVYVTAGHCAGKQPDGFQPPFGLVFFAEQVHPGVTPPSNFGFPVADPGWTGMLAKGDTHDLGVVLLAIPQPGPYATLPPAGYVDSLTKKRGQKNVNFTVVGYGVYDITPKSELADFQRRQGTTQLQTADAYNLRMTDSPGNGTGGSGTCYGDSGGPVLQGNTLVGVISFGTTYCMGTSGAYRVDTTGARSFLSDFVPVP
jgi:Trypsin